MSRLALNYNDNKGLDHYAQFFRTHGIGLLLYKKIIEKTEQTSIKKIIGLVNTDSSNPIKLLKKIGFKLNDLKKAVLKVSK